MNFTKFKQSVAKQFATMTKDGVLFRVDLDKNALWDAYLAAFPAGSDPLFKTRSEHNCNCCKNFIRTIGNVVSIKNGVVSTIWDGDVDGEPAYQAVAEVLRGIVRAAPVVDYFLHYEAKVGTEKSFSDMVGGKVVSYDHFAVTLPAAFVLHKDMIPTKLNELRSSRGVFARALAEFSVEDVDTILELIAQNSLYRGADYKFMLTEIRKHLVAAKKKGVDVDMYAWEVANGVTPAVKGIRNSAIGTLLIDLAGGMELEDAVKRFEATVAPANYKRPTALVTKAMIEKAKKDIEAAGLTSALQRRYAVLGDITVNNVLFANRDSKKVMGGDVFDELAASASTKKPKSLDKVEEVTIDKFLSDILPNAKNVEVMMTNGQTGNLVSLITAVDPTAKNLFKWNNPFSWSYNGDVADSIKERVKAAGGNVTGELCCRLAWEYTDDLDFHMRETARGSADHIYFGTRGRRSVNGGMLDVDANGCSGMMEHPVENIFYNSVSTMRDGTYELSVHNYSRRSPGVGFEVEIDLLGDVFYFNYDKVIGGGSTIVIANIVKKGGTITVEPVLKSTGGRGNSKDVWGIKTNTFQRVNAVMLSPNYWDDQGVGNKHVFFMVDGCANDGAARGFYNEFLHPELDKHRKVMEMVGSKLKTEKAEVQLSGLGFSTTQRNSILCKVEGAFTRTVKVVF